jgi:hypothetical protein
MSLKLCTQAAASAGADALCGLTWLASPQRLCVDCSFPRDFPDSPLCQQQASSDVTVGVLSQAARPSRVRVPFTRLRVPSPHAPNWAALWPAVPSQSCTSLAVVRGSAFVGGFCWSAGDEPAQATCPEYDAVIQKPLTPAPTLVFCVVTIWGRGSITRNAMV